MRSIFAGKQERKVECFWSNSTCKSKTETKPYCEHSGDGDILSNGRFCDPFPSKKKCKGPNGKDEFGYQKNKNKKEDICKEIRKDCNDKWTDVIHQDNDFAYAFCQSENFGIIYKEVD